MRRGKKTDCPKITVNEVSSKIKSGSSVRIIDVRLPSAYKASHLKGAISMPFNKYDGTKPDFLPDLNEEIIVYCYIGVASADITKKLIDIGYTNVKSMKGGHTFWRILGDKKLNEKGMPLSSSGYDGKRSEEPGRQFADLSVAENCVHCHVCRDNCEFLSKYGIDIGDTEKLRELSYHCFLCGKCTEVCPVKIDGKQMVLDLRRERVDSAEKQELEKTYKGALGEKRNYKFRNWKHVTGGTVFFPGCNFPSLFPKTCTEVVHIFEKHGIGTVYECCGKPIGELGFIDDEERILSEIRAKLKENNINEIVLACPNCRGFFGDKLGVKVTGVYAKLKELGEGRDLNMDAKLFLPCPDRQGDVWLDEIKGFIKGEISCVEGVQCCGLGGNAPLHEKEIAKSFTDKLSEQDPGQVYTYCASCTGAFKRNGFSSINHILPLILDTNETPDTLKSYFNRIFTKFK